MRELIPQSSKINTSTLKTNNSAIIANNVGKERKQESENRHH